MYFEMEAVISGPLRSLLLVLLFHSLACSSEETLKSSPDVFVPIIKVGVLPPDLQFLSVCPTVFYREEASPYSSPVSWRFTSAKECPLPNTCSKYQTSLRYSVLFSLIYALSISRNRIFRDGLLAEPLKCAGHKLSARNPERISRLTLRYANHLQDESYSVLR